MFQRTRALLAATALIASAAAGAHAATYLHAELTDDAEATPTHPTTDAGQPRVSFGHADFWISDDQTSMTMSVTVTGVDFGGQTPDLHDNLSNAHIHANSTVVAGGNAPVVWGFFGSPFNDNNPDDQVVTPFTTGVGGTITGKWDLSEGNAGATFNQPGAPNNQLANILNGHAYINFHTAEFPGGELRGFLQLPEPASLSLLALPALALLRRRPR